MVLPTLIKYLHLTVNSNGTTRIRYTVGPKVSSLTYKSHAKCKMLRGIYSAIYGEVSVSVEKCVEIKGDYVEK